MVGDFVTVPNFLEREPKFHGELVSVLLYHFHNVSLQFVYFVDVFDVRESTEEFVLQFFGLDLGQRVFVAVEPVEV